MYKRQEESSPEDVDFSDGSEAEILADPVEQAQEDAGNDVTETPEVGITFTEPEGWQTDTATVTMDKQNPAVRQYIANRAELLGAIRLPNNADVYKRQRCGSNAYDHSDAAIFLFFNV